ncbi:MAG: DUF1294 domain-containing protein [Bacilli bacterium]
MKLTCLLIWNCIVLLIYGLDKLKAIKNKRRVSEKSLIIIAFLFGSFGAFFGINFFRHKIKKIKFQIIIPLFLIIHTLIIIYL